MSKDQHKGLPFKWGPVSNGEFVPPPMSPVVREAQRRAVAMGEANAARLGMSRRKFFSTLSGAAVCLVSLNACSSEQKRANGGGEPGGSFDVSATSTTEPAAAYEELAGHEFIMDVQTHFADHDLTVPLEPGQAFFGSSFPFSNCDVGQEGGDARLCFTVDSYLEELFFNSDTSLAVLSALPFPGDDVFMAPAAMDETARTVNALCAEDRVLVHGAAFPHHGSLDAALAAMTEARETRELAAWKIYTMLPPDAAFYFDDHDPDRPQIGQAFIDHVREIGPPIICTHKGLKDIVFSDEELTSPADIGLAAARNPDISFVVYHSGYEIGHAEEPYSEETAHQGTNRLIKSLLDAGVEPNSNVYAELGGTWRLTMGDPERAAHVLGKLLKYVGEDRVVWGTDSIWFGSPQDQIQTLRTFQISEEFQERYGYPALTDEVKAKIFGLTSAELYGVDPASVYCPMTREELQAAREEVAIVPRTYGPTDATELAAHLRAHGAFG
jgi:uncharacterized protein